MEHLLFTQVVSGRIHLGVTGSVAAVKCPELLRMWTKSGVSVGATLTQAACSFLTPLAMQALGADPVYQAMFPVDPGGEYAHLAPGRTANAMVIAPASANTLAKIAHGLADDMLSCQVLSFSGPLVLSPAMNHVMWRNPAVQQNWSLCKQRGHVCIEPDSGDLACGDTDAGRLPAIERLYLHGLRAMAPQDLAGARVLVTLGPTSEPWDAVRRWTNPSSGRMGIAVCLAAWLRGASVIAVCGPTSLWIPPEIARIEATTAKAMYTACADLWPNMDIGCFTAAVADFSPVLHTRGKYKKSDAQDEDLRISFTRTPDILASMGKAKKKSQKILAFAAESDNLERNALSKLQRKNADVIAANRIGGANAGFGVTTNTLFVADTHGRQEHWNTAPKTSLAWNLMQWLATL